MNPGMYPLPGMHFVPSLIRDAFQEPLPEEYQRLLAPRLYLSELDAGVWALLTPAQWKELGDLVVETARRRLLSPDLLRRRIPPPPPGVSLEALCLMKRTYNALLRAGLTADTGRLAGMTLGDLLNIRALGVKCALDYLTSVESMSVLMGTCAAAAVDDQVMHRARELRRRLGPLAARITNRDLRLGTFVQRLLSRPGTLAEALDGLAAGEIIPMGAPGLLSALEQALDRWSRAALEDELEDLLQRVRVRERNRTIIYKMYGLDGGVPRTLQSVGDEFGITRERVRQICVRAANRLQGRLGYFPSLDRALELLAAVEADTADEVMGDLLARGILRGPVAIEGLAEVARWAGRPVEFVVLPFEGVRVVGRSDLGERLAVMRSTVRRLAAAQGAVSFAQVVRVLEEEGSILPAGLVCRLLPQIPGFEWLDEGSGWFWLSEPLRNHLLTVLGKMLAVTPHLRESDVRSGLARSARFGGPLPPAEVLLRLCSRLPDIAVEGDTIRALRRPSWGLELSPVEQVLVNILRKHGGVMHRSDLERCCLERGVNRATFNAYLGTSPVIARLGAGMYGLCGVPPDFDALQRSPGRRRQGRKVVLGWTLPTADQVTITYLVTGSMVGTGVVPIPAALNQRLAHRRFTWDNRGLDSEDKPMTVAVKPYTAWGFSKLLRRLAAAEGNVMEVSFDLACGTVDVTLRPRAPGNSDAPAG